MKLRECSHLLNAEQQKTLALYWTNDFMLPGFTGVGCVVELDPENTRETRATAKIMGYVRDSLTEYLNN